MPTENNNNPPSPKYRRVDGKPRNHTRNNNNHTYKPRYNESRSFPTRYQQKNIRRKITNTKTKPHSIVLSSWKVLGKTADQNHMTIMADMLEKEAKNIKRPQIAVRDITSKNEMKETCDILVEESDINNTTITQFIDQEVWEFIMKDAKKYKMDDATSDGQKILIYLEKRMSEIGRMIGIGRCEGLQLTIVLDKNLNEGYARELMYYGAVKYDICNLHAPRYKIGELQIEDQDKKNSRMFRIEAKNIASFLAKSIQNRTIIEKSNKSASAITFLRHGE